MAATKAPKLDGAHALCLLSSAAMALPAYSSAPPDQASVDYQFFRYEEAAIPTQSGESDRYAIDGHKIIGVTPLGRDFSLNADLTVETMSGASPWFITPDSNGQPVQVLSGASIQDDRQDLLVSLTRHGKVRSLTGSLGVSEEDDYHAVNVSLELGVEPKGKQHSYSFGVSFSDDKIEPTEGGSQRFPSRIVEADKQQFGLSTSFTQILNATTVFQLGASLSRSRGFLSDPYKLVYVDGQTVQDSRPDERTLGALFLRLRRYFKSLGGAGHLDYRTTGDDWDIQTHALEGRWLQNLSSQVRLVLGTRYYSQSQADFYAPYFSSAPQDGLVSSDYRLSPFGALSFTLELAANLGAWDLAAGFEQYEARAEWAASSVDVENPGLLEYQMVHARVAYRF